MHAELSGEAFLNEGWREHDLASALVTWRRDGFAILPGVVSPTGLEVLRQRAHAIMTGAIDHSPFFFQHDSETGRYEDAPLGLGWVGPSPAYRKIEKLERDQVFAAYLANPLFELIARTAIPESVAVYRTILMTKPNIIDHAVGGTDLPWHQDGGRLWGLSADPQLQLWTALDDAPIASGCMRFAVGSHVDGLATPLGGKVPDSLVNERLDRYPVIEVPAKAGDVVLLHNLVWHASGLNTTTHTRRALSVCLIPASTRCMRKRGAPRVFPRLFE